jgi:excisionase family DNA binding protein
MGVDMKKRKTGSRRRVYSVPELAEMLGRSVPSIYNDLSSGRIPSKRLGKQYIVAKESFDRWFSRTEAAAS